VDETEQTDEQVVEGAADGGAGDAGAAIREAYLATLRAQPGVIPELIGGTTQAEIAASVARARAAYSAAQAAVLREVRQAVPPAHGGAQAAAAPAPGYATILAGVSKGKYE
jgi:hypothetical protein